MKNHTSIKYLSKKEPVYIGWDSKIDVFGKFFDIYITQSEFENMSEEEIDKIINNEYDNKKASGEIEEQIIVRVK